MIKKLKLNYFLIPIVVIFVSVLGSFITQNGMAWYDGLILPEIVPQGSFIGLVWTVIFVLSTISALILWNYKKNSENKKTIITLFIFNAFLNLFWSILFFGFHFIFVSIIEMILLNLTVLFLIIYSWKISKTASVLLWPYFVWVCFATYLACQIFILN